MTIDRQRALTFNTSFLGRFNGLATLALLVGLAAGCGDDPVSKIDLPGEPEAQEQAPVEIASTDGCAIDADCAEGRFCFLGQCAYECDATQPCADGLSCGPRGQCVSAPNPGDGGAGETPAKEPRELPSTLRVLNSPDTVYHLGKEQESITLTLELSEPAPEQGVRYRVARGYTAEDDATRAQIQYSTGGARTVEITLDAGSAALADPEDRKIEQVRVYTELGDYRLAIVPHYAVSGSYVGTATFETFGSTGLPIEFQVVTKPDGVNLDEAEKAWLVLPVGEQFLFSPVADPEVEYVARELVYDDFVEQWVAKFEFGFALDAEGIVSAPATQVRRALRFQVEPGQPGPQGRTLIGEFSDTWTGLYDGRSASGVRQIKDVQFSGQLAMSRFTAAPSYQDISVDAYPNAGPGLQDAPPVDQCDAAVFTGAEATIDSGVYDCASIASAADFESADADAQAACAIAVSHEALSGATTGEKIRDYLDGNATNEFGQSFGEFMEDCAAGTDGTCRPGPQVLCARQLTAHAYRSQDAHADVAHQLVDQYGAVTREAFLGQELGAFGTDSRLRLEWLKSTDYPAVVVSEVKALNEQLLDDWKQKVLDVHLSVLKGQFDPSGLAVLSQEPEGAQASDSRKQLLTYMTQSWRGSMNALTLATTRWNGLLQVEADRAEKAQMVSSRLVDLYLAAGILRNLNLAAGTGYLSAQLADGFADLQRELGKLSLPFDELIYARDAEVVVNTSVDPQSGNDTLLAEREDDAVAEIERAHGSVTSVIERAQAEALSETELRNRMNNEVNDLRDSLVELCGLPVGCTTNDIRTDPTCRVRVDAGKCGFLLDKETDQITGFGSGDQSVSEGGRALLDVANAAQNIGIAQADLDALVQRAALEKQELDVFAVAINDWNTMRLSGVERLETNIAKRQAIRDEAVNQILDDVSERAQIRAAAIESTRETFADWDKIRREGVEVEMGYLISANAAQETADTMRNSAETIHDFTDAFADGLPKGSDDFMSAGRLSTKLVGAATTAGLRTGAMGFDIAATVLETAREAYQLDGDATMAKLQDDNDLSSAITEQELDDLKDHMIATETQSQAEIDQLQEIIEAAQAYQSAQLSFARDMDDFRQRRLDLRQKLTGIAGLDLRVQQARLQYEQAVAVYLGIAQRARLQDAKLQDLLRQRERVNELVGSPAVIFGRANRLDQAEVRLDRAKDKLMDWLVALEYYAVRPFMNQRLSILLARNTYQLEKIAEDLKRLQRSCGGPTNQVSSDLSLRDGLLGLSLPSLDPVTGESMSPSERLRAVLGRGYVPVDKRVRYSTDDSIGSLMSRDPDILSATFFIDLSDFANLELTCNAKIRSVDVELVGDLGEARPTVSILYDGTSALRSCQPGIDDYVAQFGANATNYGKITHLRTVGRSMSPVAGINEFGDPSTSSQTLGGLPLASQYTILINKRAGENSKVDWSKLEDVRLRLSYDYQDIFPVGQCE
ncbi:hypothetical protein [Bradymonas sediminis]|uniref:hypothetical protein n=1 Tax=Bradymonas sediminis TaxID=1548548 RepID=UPI001060627B|nr:hypothetical protein [Bradymonas sediminis]TDP75375.1 hypothetical protein DFR33_104240 [Bradymonas sediminis]